jgi:hypothetical protein
VAERTVTDRSYGHGGLDALDEEMRGMAHDLDVYRRRSEDLTTERDEWRSLAKELRVATARISGILCDASDVSTDVVDGVRELVAQRDALRVLCDQRDGVAKLEADIAARRERMAVPEVDVKNDRGVYVVCVDDIGVEWCVERKDAEGRAATVRKAFAARTAAPSPALSDDETLPLRVTRESDSELTCVVCGGRKTDRTVYLPGSGRSVWYGLHSACMTWVQKRLASDDARKKIDASEGGAVKPAVPACGWQDEDDEGMPTGPPCGKPAEFYSCSGWGCGPACAEHKCRCPQPRPACAPPAGEVKPLVRTLRQGNGGILEVLGTEWFLDGLSSATDDQEHKLKAALAAHTAKARAEAFELAARVADDTAGRYAFEHRESAQIAALRVRALAGAESADAGEG